MSTPYDWRINDIERNAERGADALRQVESLRSDVASLERLLGETRAECSRICDELQAALRAIWALQDEMTSLKGATHEQE